jgi:hypothetical protein
LFEVVWSAPSAEGEMTSPLERRLPLHQDGYVLSRSRWVSSSRPQRIKHVPSLMSPPPPGRPLDNPLSEHTFLSSRPSSLPPQALPSNSSSASVSSPSSYSSSFPSWVSSPYASFPASSSSFGHSANSLIGQKEAGLAEGGKKKGYEDGHLRQMVAHSSLDLIEDGMIGGTMSVVRPLDRSPPSSEGLSLSPTYLVQVSQGCRQVQRVDCLRLRGSMRYAFIFLPASIEQKLIRLWLSFLSVKFILLHEVKNEEGIRLFFLDVWEAYVKVCLGLAAFASFDALSLAKLTLFSVPILQILLNPFHTPNTPIKSPLFDAKVRASAKRNL